MVSPTGLTITVASGASVSGVFSQPGGTALCAIVTPGTLDGTTDGIAFKGWSGVTDGTGTFANLYTSGGTLITVTSTSALSPHGATLTENARDSLKSFGRLKLLLTDGGSADAQTAARSFWLRFGRI